MGPSNDPTRTYCKFTKLLTGPKDFMVECSASHVPPLGDAEGMEAARCWAQGMISQAAQEEAIQEADAKDRLMCDCCQGYVERHVDLVRSGAELLCEDCADPELAAELAQVMEIPVTQEDLDAFNFMLVRYGTVPRGPDPQPEPNASR